LVRIGERDPRSPVAIDVTGEKKKSVVGGCKGIEEKIRRNPLNITTTVLPYVCKRGSTVNSHSSMTPESGKLVCGQGRCSLKSLGSKPN